MKLAKILPKVPDELVGALEEEFAELESRFARRDWRPTELDGGRLGEAILRYLEWKSTGAYTPIGTQLNRQTIVNLVTNDATLPAGLRIHVRRCTEILLDVRNQRDVGHLGAEVSVNEMDSRLVNRLASWTLSEIVREETNVPPEEAQAIVDRLSARNLSLVEEVGGDLIVVATDLKHADRALVALYQRYPKPMNIAVLRGATKHSHSTKFRRLLEEKEGEGLVHFKEDDVFLTSKGAAWVDRNIDLELKV